MKKQTLKAKRLTEIKKSFKKLQRLMENHLNEALNKDLKDFGTDLKKFLESKDLKVKLAKGGAQPYYEPIGKKPSFAALVLGNQDTELLVIVNDSKRGTIITNDIIIRSKPDSTSISFRCWSRD